MQSSAVPFLKKRKCAAYGKDAVFTGIFDCGKWHCTVEREGVLVDFMRKAYVLEQLGRALEKDELQVYYQPVYDCRTGTYTTAESLVRLFAEDGELISPAEFIPLAEKNDLIDAVSWAVWRKVCVFLGTHPELPLKAVSVNLTARQIETPEMMNKLQEFLKKIDLAGKKIWIEITERSMAEDPQAVSDVMEELGKEGIGFYLDDFGIGYSNLAGVLKLPFEVVKLDCSLFQDIDTEEKMHQMVYYLIKMLHCGGFNVVAEGVEEEAQARLAKEVEVDLIQGYYYARPIPEDELVKFLRVRQ